MRGKENMILDDLLRLIKPVGKIFLVDKKRQFTSKNKR